jgi:hypothetical protein
MIERTKKPTLEQIRTLIPFNVATIATQAGVSTGTLNRALAEGFQIGESVVPGRQYIEVRG